jgi:uncharacterized membrane protein YtjA (UPF0391 family)
VVTDLLLWLPALICLIAAIVSAIIGVVSDQGALAWLAHVLFIMLLVVYVFWIKRMAKSRR